MQTSSEFILENIKSIFENNKNIFVTPNIPDKKINNVIKAFKIDNYKNIVAIYDNTIFGAADEGIAFLGEKMVLKSDTTSPKEILYSDIDKLEYECKEIETKPGKIEKQEKLFFINKNGEKSDISYCLIASNYKHLESFINKMLESCSSFKNEDLLKPLEEMSQSFKEAYIKIVINMAYSDDDKIDSKEQAEIFYLMSKINLDQETRMNVREYLVSVNKDSMNNIKDLLEILKQEAEPSVYKSYMISLTKELVNLHYATKLDSNASEFDFITAEIPFVKQYQELFGVSDEQLRFICESLQNDYKLLNNDIEDSQMKQMMKDTAAKAAGIGVPLGAVYLSGSVAGLSAAGMTSGLAALGMGGILGFSAMATGIGTVVLIGVVAYQGVKFLTSDNSLSKYKVRELMLHEILKQNQKTISQVIGDINYLVEKLNNVIIESNKKGEALSIKEAQIKKLVSMMVQYQGALDAINGKNARLQSMEARLHVPKTLDESKLKKLTSEAMKAQYYDIVMQNYTEITNDDKKEYALKTNLNAETLETLANILKVIGYIKA
ncbi:hypothetical protein DCO58_08590 [Helicobacter saguini]|uniref:Uncharacterized protein n=1 Tax=Helicobacter saguini TaxID=1548018 RepID=A0A347VXI6_9HELI|nr:hypothetical protein [Helicobacter saguini]MWV61619.1 hypothetical protein [Helicobacter saguini]MWV67709.1 hypothetical protein [Helicobacter saguini]MWV70061.1 hypothetical protein [Helicobacter saguini]MWV72726.1 hypothetical protein [Helicobacter saguini]TLD92011.1 hypothetical protein LS64_010900 [Helicobacter saguini]